MLINNYFNYEMLGYTLAMLNEYVPTLEFEINTCKCTWYQS